MRTTFIVGLLVVGLAGCHVDSPRPAAHAAEAAKADAPPASDPELAQAQKPAGAAAAKPEDELDKRWAELQAEPLEKAKSREKAIDDLESRGVILKVTTLTRYPRVYVGPAFSALSVDDKGFAMWVVLTKYFKANKEAQTAVLMDGMTGKQIGKYRLESGLDLD